MRQTFLLIMALVLSTGPALALELRGECRVHFTGSSTLHDFDGTGSCEPFVLRVTETAGGEAIIPETVVTVAVAGMQTGNASRDKKMRQMFDSRPVSDDRRQAWRGTAGGTAPATARGQAGGRKRFRCDCASAMSRRPPPPG